MRVGLAHRLPWHPIAFAIAIVTMFWVDAAVSPFAGLRSLVITVLTVAAAQSVLTLALRDAKRAALLVTLLLSVLLSKFLLIAAQNVLEQMDLAVAVVWLLLIAITFLLLVRIIRRRWRNWSVGPLTYGLNVASVAVLVVALANGILVGRVDMILADIHQGRSLDAQLAADPVASSASQRSPDMYLLLLDGYPRADTLKRVFDYDNDKFLESLGDLGFDVANASRSDYLWTHFTLTSMLHRDFIERITALQPLRREGAPIHPTVRQVINRNPTFDDFRAAGYEIVTTAVPIERYAIRQSDMLIDHGELNEFELKLLASTFVGDIVNLSAPSFAADQHRRRIVNALDELPRIAAEADGPPQFVLAHLLTPHHPVVWKSDGSDVSPPLAVNFYGDTLSEQDVAEDEFVDRYRGQLQHVNRIVLDAIDGIIRSSSREAVIIIMSDHGSGFGTDPDDPEHGDLKERTGNLFAARTPGHDQLFPDTITPVDVFRYLFDAYFDTNLGPATPLPGGQHIELTELAD